MAIKDNVSQSSLIALKVVALKIHLFTENYFSAENFVFPLI